MINPRRYKTFKAFFKAWLKSNKLSNRKAGALFGFSSSSAIPGFVDGRLIPNREFIDKLLELCQYSKSGSEYLMTLWVLAHVDAPYNFRCAVLSRMGCGY